MSEQSSTGEMHNRKYPPHVLKVSETGNTALLVDTDGSVYRKYYDPSYGGGIGSVRIRLGAPLILMRPSVRKAIRDAWAAQDQAHELIRQRQQRALDAAAEVVRAAGLPETPEDLYAQAGQPSGYQLPDGTQLLLRTSPLDGVTPQWRRVDGSSEPEDLTPEQVATLFSRGPETQIPARAPARISVPRALIERGQSAPGIDS